MKITFRVMGYDEEEGFIPPAVEVEDYDKFVREAISDNAHWGEQIMILKEIDGVLINQTGWLMMEELAIRLEMFDIDFDDNEWPDRWGPREEIA